MSNTTAPILRIRNQDDLANGVAHLKNIDEALWSIAQNLEEVPLRLRPPGFEGLADIITAQMVSRASATAIFSRLTNLIQPFNAETLSRFVFVFSNGVSSCLTSLKGIGPWTAEVFLLFCAGHADIFPAGDIALQHATADVLGIPERPDTKSTIDIAKRWAPVRGVAARILYAHYAVSKKRSTIPV